VAHLIRPTITKYIDADGKRVPPGTRKATKVTEKASKWYGVGIPGQPPKKRVPLASDKEAARRLLANMVRDAEQGDAKMPDRLAAGKPLLEHLTEFRADLGLGLAGGRHKRPPSDRQADLVEQRVHDVLVGCKFKVVADLNSDSPAKLARYLRERRAKPRKEGGLSAQSATFFLATMRRFARWLAAKRVGVTANLFDAIPGFDPSNNREHARREITPTELAKVLDTAKASNRTVGKLSGLDRHHLYLTAFATGFRSGELAKLTPDCFALSEEPPSVALPGKSTKNKKAARQILPPAVAISLRSYLAGKPADKPVWPGNWRKYPVKVLRADLADAGVPYRVEGRAGAEYADFHSLRHTFVTALSSAGVGPKELQELARHSDPRLTLGLYTHSRSAELVKAIGRLQVPGQAPPGLLAGLTREELEGAVLGLALILGTILGGAGANQPGVLLAPPLAPRVGISGDDGRHLDTIAQVGRR
jgi:integrase